MMILKKIVFGVFLQASFSISLAVEPNNEGPRSVYGEGSDLEENMQIVAPTAYPESKENPATEKEAEEYITDKHQEGADTYASQHHVPENSPPVEASPVSLQGQKSDQDKETKNKLDFKKTYLRKKKDSKASKKSPQKIGKDEVKHAITAPITQKEKGEEEYQKLHSSPQFSNQKGGKQFNAPLYDIHEDHLYKIEDDHNKMIEELAEIHMARDMNKKHFEQANLISMEEREHMEANHKELISTNRQKYLTKLGISVEEQIKNVQYYMPGGLFDHETVYKPRFQQKRDAERDSRNVDEASRYRDGCRKKRGSSV